MRLLDAEVVDVDEGRVFFVPDVEEPPVSYVVHDPEARDAEAYADAQGFDWGRELDGGWSALGHSSDVEQQSSMWVDRRSSGALIRCPRTGRVAPGSGRGARGR